MKKSYLFIILLCFSITLYSQSIRKNYLEMTDYEKSELVNAFYQLRQGPDLFNDLSNFHMNFFNFDNTSDPTREDLHFNLPDESERDIFLAWHRRQMFEIEQAMQDINPKISLAFWDSSQDQSTTGPLWDNVLLGSFNTNWSLGRNLGARGPMPTATDVSNILTFTDFHDFSNELERRAVHRGAHVWTGGAMPTPVSPRDPVFYFHHSFVDKVWKDWEELHQGSFFTKTSMLRYDGTYVFDGETLPLVNPNDIIDTRSLGVFYGENGLAKLDNYIVSNSYRAEEVFYYQYEIEVGDNFIVPEGTNSSIESVSEINFEPGFEVFAGASFDASIDNNITNKRKINQEKRDYMPYDVISDLKPIVWEEGDNEGDTILITASPNPFTEKITITLSKKMDCAIEVFNMMGMLVREESFQNTDKLVINKLYGLSAGFYVIRVVGNNGEIILAKKIVKL